jgi:hypothetical protein
MGRGDRRKSPKMRQRISGRKLKARQKRKREAGIAKGKKPDAGASGQ